MSGTQPSGRRNFRTPGTATVLLSAALLAAMGCAARKPRSFLPAAGADVKRALAAWQEAVARSEGLPSSRMLYEAHLAQGLFRVTGTLAVKQSRHGMEASLTGPFGSPVATYSDGAIRGERIRPVTIAPEPLRALLAGAWNGSTPEILGVEGEDALLGWEGEERVEGILDMRRSRFQSISVAGAQGRIMATYSGEFDPWPSRIEVEDAASGARLRLALLAHEALE